VFKNQIATILTIVLCFKNLLLMDFKDLFLEVQFIFVIIQNIEMRYH
jgi:hypothetical protein